MSLRFDSQTKIRAFFSNTAEMIQENLKRFVEKERPQAWDVIALSYDPSTHTSIIIIGYVERERGVKKSVS